MFNHKSESGRKQKCLFLHYVLHNKKTVEFVTHTTGSDLIGRWNVWAFHSKNTGW